MSIICRLSSLVLVCWTVAITPGLGQPLQQFSPQRALFTAFEKGDLMVAISTANWRPGLCLAAAPLAVGQTVSLEVNLLARTEYVFISTGASQRSDIDLILRDSSGTIVKQDLEDDATPILEFKPSTSGVYQLQVHLVAGFSPQEFITLAMLRNKGIAISERSYLQTAGSFFATVQELQKANQGVSWHQQAGQWCFFGLSLAAGRGATLQNLRPGSGPRLITASGSQEIKNIDLYLADKAGTIIAKDNGPDASPLLNHHCPPDAVFDLRIEVERARAIGLLLVGLFDQ